jgi:hypothetical protein
MGTAGGKHHASKLVQTEFAAGGRRVLHAARHVVFPVNHAACLLRFGLPLSGDGHEREQSEHASCAAESVGLSD